jgi:tetratricopeptide (TPR) repeat protein
MRALLDGQLGEAEQLAAEALAGGAPGEGVTAAQYYAIQLLVVRRDQGRMGELEQAARQLADGNPARPAWRAALATTLWETDRLEEARAEFDKLAASDFSDITRDGDWITTMMLLCDACAAVGDEARAPALYAEFLPFADVNVVAGLGVACLGPAARVLGKLAATAGHADHTVRHFEHALELSRRLDAPVLLARTQLDFAEALGRGSRADEMTSEAAETAERLGLGAIARRAARLRSG